MISQVKRGWRVDMRLGTNRIRKLFPSRKIAQVFEITQKNKYLEGKYLPGAKRNEIPFNLFADEYYQNHCLANNKSPERTTRYSLDKMKSYFDGKPLSKISRQDCQKWHSHLLQSVSRATADRQLTLLKSLFNRAVEWEKIPASPAKFVKKDTSQHRQKDRWLTKEEIHALLKVCDSDLRRIVIVAINTGLRKHNLVILEPADIRGVEGTIKVRKTKSNHEYYAYLNDELRDLFKEIPMAPNEPILNTRNLDRRFRRAVKASKIASCTLHDLRHTFASHLVMKGVDLYTVSKLLGHKTIAMTQRYAHLAPDHMKLAVGMLSFVGKPQVTPKEAVSVLSERR